MPAAYSDPFPDAASWAGVPLYHTIPREIETPDGAVYLWTYYDRVKGHSVERCWSCSHDTPPEQRRAAILAIMKLEG